jgi:hypothetical protein
MILTLFNIVSLLFNDLNYPLNDDHEIALNILIKKSIGVIKHFFHYIKILIYTAYLIYRSLHKF